MSVCILKKKPVERYSIYLTVTHKFKNAKKVKNITVELEMPLEAGKQNGLNNHISNL